MKVKKSEFIRFKKKFLQLQNLLGLRNYKVYFKFEPLKDAFGGILINQSGMVATVAYSSELTKADSCFRPEPEECAAHEVAHLFISKLSYLANERYLNPEEICAEEESIVRILEKIL